MFHVVVGETWNNGYLQGILHFCWGSDHPPSRHLPWPVSWCGGGRVGGKKHVKSRTYMWICMGWTLIMWRGKKKKKKETPLSADMAWYDMLLSLYCQRLERSNLIPTRHFPSRAGWFVIFQVKTRGCCQWMSSNAGHIMEYQTTDETNLYSSHLRLETAEKTFPCEKVERRVAYPSSRSGRTLTIAWFHVFNRLSGPNNPEWLTGYRYIVLHTYPSLLSTPEKDGTKIKEQWPPSILQPRAHQENMKHHHVSFLSPAFPSFRADTYFCMYIVQRHTSNLGLNNRLCLRSLPFSSPPAFAHNIR